MKPILSQTFAGKAASRLTGLAAAAMLVATLAACTTTTRMSQVQPLPPSKTPTTDSELHVAETALNSGNVDLATNVYQHIVQVNPKSVEGLTGLGNTLYTVGDFTRAGVYFDHASQFDPSAIAPLIGTARVAIHQRRFDDAIATYRHVLTLSPDNPTAEGGLGTALDMKGDHAGAQNVLRQALKTHPGDPLLSIDLGLSLTLGGNPREGANVLLDVTRYPEAPPQARQDLALAYGLLGNDEAAAAILSADLPKATVQDNLRYYEAQRARLSGASSAPEATRVSPVSSIAVPTAGASVHAIKPASVTVASKVASADSAATTARYARPAQPAVAVPAGRGVSTAQAEVPAAKAGELPSQLQVPLTDR